MRTPLRNTSLIALCAICIHLGGCIITTDALVSGPSGSASENEQAIAELLTRDAGQERTSLRHNEILAKVARERAEDLAAREYFSHTNPDGLGANRLVTLAGYRLPDFYDASPAGNNIESLVAGTPSPKEAWKNWMTSPPHRAHLLGLEPFYREQTEYGVGYAYARGSPYGHYWVVLIAKPAAP